MRERGVSRVREQRLRQGGLFVPLVFSFAASLEGLTPEEFLGSPTKLSNGLRTVFASFGVDGVAGWCDNTAPAATLGCRLDWADYPPVVEAPSEGVPGLDGIGVEGATGVAAEVVRRLGTLLPDTVLLGTMPGPVALARQLAGVGSSGGLADDSPDLEQVRAAAKVCLAYAKALGDAGIDVLLVREDHLLAPDDGASPGDIARVYSSIWNTARFYGLAALLALGDESDHGGTGGAGDRAARLEPLAGVVDGIVAPPAWAAGYAAALGSGVKRMGLALPPGLLAAPRGSIREYLEEHLAGERMREGRPFLITTDGEVPPDVDRAALIVGIETTRDHVREELSSGA